MIYFCEIIVSTKYFLEYVDGVYIFQSTSHKTISSSTPFGYSVQVKSISNPIYRSTHNLATFLIFAASIIPILESYSIANSSHTLL